MEAPAEAQRVLVWGGRLEIGEDQVYRRQGYVSHPVVTADCLRFVLSISQCAARQRCIIASSELNADRRPVTDTPSPFKLVTSLGVQMSPARRSSVDLSTGWCYSINKSLPEAYQGERQGVARQSGNGYQNQHLAASSFFALHPRRVPIRSAKTQQL